MERDGFSDELSVSIRTVTPACVRVLGSMPADETEHPPRLGSAALLLVPLFLSPLFLREARQHQKCFVRCGVERVQRFMVTEQHPEHGSRVDITDS